MNFNMFYDIINICEQNFANSADISMLDVV